MKTPIFEKGAENYIIVLMKSYFVEKEQPNPSCSSHFRCLLDVQTVEIHFLCHSNR